MTQAIRLHETGGPEVLRLEEVEVGDPGPGQARVRHSLIAVNFIDIYFRTGRYPLPLPDGASGLGPTRWAWSRRWGRASPTSARATASAISSGRKAPTRDVRVMPADVLIPLPDGVCDRTAADADDEGHDGAVPVPPGLSAEGRRDHPVSRGRRRRRA